MLLIYNIHYRKAHKLLKRNKIEKNLRQFMFVLNLEKEKDK